MTHSFTRFSTWISSGILLSFASVQNALAVNLGNIPDTGGGNANIHGALSSLITKVLTFLGIIAVIVIVIAGIRMIIGGADEGAREKARNSILYAVIGLIIVLLAGAIVRWVGDLTF